MDNVWIGAMTRVIGITAESVRLEFPPNRYMADFPVVMVTIHGGVTQVGVSSPKEFVAGLGEVHTHVMLTFQTGDVGKSASVIVVQES